MRFNTSNARYSLIGTWIGCALLAASSALAQTEISYRQTGIVYDFDNNTETDATTTVTYDAGGRATDLLYLYVGDGTPDLFVTEDDGAVREDSIVGYNADDLIESFDLDRQNSPSGSEQFATTHTFIAGQLSRVDFTSTTPFFSISSYSTFAYSGGSMDSVVERFLSDDSLIYTQTYDYGGDELPDVVSFDSAGALGQTGMDVVTNLSWRPDGQVDDLASVVTTNGMVSGSGTADYVYDAEGTLLYEAWSDVGPGGAFFSEFFGQTYRKTYVYDAMGLKVGELIDIGDDGTIEATRTFLWEQGDCVTGFIWAPNGRPNFAYDPSLPYVPGTGAISFRNCPEPGFALSTLLGGVVLGGLGRQRRRDIESMRSRKIGL